MKVIVDGKNVLKLRDRIIPISQRELSKNIVLAKVKIIEVDKNAIYGRIEDLSPSSLGSPNIRLVVDSVQGLGIGQEHLFRIDNVIRSYVGTVFEKDVLYAKGRLSTVLDGPFDSLERFITRRRVKNILLLLSPLLFLIFYIGSK